jgi:hypothetical protein
VKAVGAVDERVHDGGDRAFMVAIGHGSHRAKLGA